jgi:hypothetical protein
MPNEINNPPNRFEPKSHFFAESGVITQSASQGFGPVSADEFRLTSLFSVAAPTKAFAICSGLVLIQPQTGSADRINLILRPFTQPIQGVNIRYFVYRGLQKSDFVDSSNHIIASSATTSEFITKINADFDAFHAGDTELPVFEGAFIGYNPALTDGSIPLDSLFFAITAYTDVNGEQVEVPETAYELPKIDLGKSLGNFATGECGIDVVLNYGDYQISNDPSLFTFDLNYARAAQAAINLTGITDDFVKKQTREQLFQFIDIAAYYGFHHTDAGIVVKDVAGTKTDVLKATLYTDVLLPFYTKNNYYLYILSDRTRSYNFYDTYLIDESSSNSLKFGLTEATMAARTYSTNGWPLIIESGDQDHEEERNTLYLQLVTDNNLNTVLYGQTACIDNAYRNHFSTIDQLRTPPDSEGLPSKFTTTIVLSNPAVVDGAAKKQVANFAFLLYQGVTYSYIAGTFENEEEETENLYAKPNFFDDVFGQITAQPLLKSESVGAYSVVTSERLRLINHYVNGKQLGISAVQTLIVNDTIETGEEANPLFERVTYITETVDVLSEAMYPFKKPSQVVNTTTANSGSTTVKRDYSFPEPYFIQTFGLTDGLKEINGLKLGTEDGSLSTKIALGLGKEENESLIEIIETNELKNGRVFLIDLFLEGNLLVSKELIPYRKYKLAVLGENEEGVLRLFIVDPVILVYAVDLCYHFTESYAKYVIDTNPYLLKFELIDKPNT